MYKIYLVFMNSITGKQEMIYLREQVAGFSKPE